MVPIRVNAPTRASNKLASAKPLVKGGSGTGGAVLSGRLQSGQLMIFPANLSSISRSAPHGHVSDRGISRPAKQKANDFQTLL
jgi:hypothetical protein